MRISSVSFGTEMPHAKGLVAEIAVRFRGRWLGSDKIYPILSQFCGVLSSTALFGLPRRFVAVFYFYQKGEDYEQEAFDKSDHHCGSACDRRGAFLHAEECNPCGLRNL